ncbi:MAG: hypothetical protein CL535_17705 [Ahrensia sp.]|nr:hypothetical protein [Ahrensia sp.]
MTDFAQPYPDADKTADKRAKDAPQWIPADAIPSRRFLIPALAALVFLKIVNVFFAVPLADEGYYWLWGKFPDWSYYDHPPLGAWMNAAASFVFGDGLLAIRLGTLATFAGSLAVLGWWTKRLTPGLRGPDAYLVAAGVWLASPWLMNFQSIAFHDHLLIFFGILAAHCFGRLVLTMDEAQGPGWHWLYAGCVSVGMAGLSKYSGVFLGLAFAAWVIATPKGRVLLKSPHLWIGASIAVAMQSPVIYWNEVHDWPSFQYNLHDRIGYTHHDSVVERYYDFCKNFVLLLSPLLFVALMRFVFGRTAKGPAAALQGIGRFAFLIPSAVFLALSFSTSVLYYWNIVAVLFFLPVALLFMRSAMEVRLHMLWGIAFAAMALFNSTFFPLTLLTGKSISDFNISHGLPEIAAIVEEEEKRLGADMVVTTDYRTASLLALTTKRTDIVHLGLREDMWYFWFDPTMHKGQNAVVLAYDRFPETELIDTVFEKTEVIREFTVERHGFAIQHYWLVYAQNYSGEGPQ